MTTLREAFVRRLQLQGWTGSEAILECFDEAVKDLGAVERGRDPEVRALLDPPPITPAERRRRREESRPPDLLRLRRELKALAKISHNMIVSRAELTGLLDEVELHRARVRPESERIGVLETAINAMRSERITILARWRETVDQLWKAGERAEAIGNIASEQQLGTIKDIRRFEQEDWREIL